MMSRNAGIDRKLVLINNGVMPNNTSESDRPTALDGSSMNLSVHGPTSSLYQMEELKHKYKQTRNEKGQPYRSLNRAKIRGQIHDQI